MTNQTNLDLIWASSGGVTDPGDTKYAAGWVAEIPTYQNFNFVLQTLSGNILAIAEKGTYEWEAGIVYEVGASVTESGERFYCITSNSANAPSTDTTSSYWIKTPFYGVPSGAPKKEQGLALRQVNSRSGTNWLSSDVTIDNEQALIQLNTTNVGQTNWLLGNVAGHLVAVDAGTNITADSRSLVPSTTYSHKIFHEGNLPTASQVTGAVGEAPIDNKIYGRTNEQWVQVVTTSVSNEPPPASIGAGTGWYNLADGHMYIDINDGDSSQWVPANPPQFNEATGGTGGSVGPIQTEEIILTAGQTSVVFGQYSTENASFYISGADVDSGRLPNSAFTVVDVSQITLTESYPAGTELKLVRNEVVGEQGGVATEVVTLTSGQSTVTFTNQTTNGAGFYLSGLDVDSGRLSNLDYYVIDDNSIELYQTYPAGTTVTLLRDTSIGSAVVGATMYQDRYTFTDTDVAVGGGNTVITLRQKNFPGTNLLTLYINGVRQAVTADYTETGTQVTIPIEIIAVDVIDIATGILAGTGEVTVSLLSSGVGSPEGSKVGVVGSMYTDTAGGPGTTLYIKELGSGNTGWVAK